MIYHFRTHLVSDNVIVCKHVGYLFRYQIISREIVITNQMNQLQVSTKIQLQYVSEWGSFVACNRELLRLLHMMEAYFIKLHIARSILFFFPSNFACTTTCLRSILRAKHYLLEAVVLGHQLSWLNGLWCRSKDLAML